MTLTDVMDLTMDDEMAPGLAARLDQVDRKLDRILDLVTGLTRRVEAIEELPADLWPMVEGVSHALSRTLADLENDGTLARVGQTLRDLARPEVLRLADRAAQGLRDAEADGADRAGLFRSLRDPDVRRGMTLMLSVLREIGHEETTTLPVPRAG